MDKFNITVIMNKSDYEKEVLHQLSDEKYHIKLDSSTIIKSIHVNTLYV